jgi:hypothetical protein
MKEPSVAAVLVLLLGGLSVAPSRPSNTYSTRDEVMAAEKARTIALDNDDLASLDRILADDLTYVHASGKVDTKQTLLDGIRSGQVHYIAWTAKRLNVRAIGGAAVVDGEYLVRVTDRRVKPNPFEVNIFILAVYAQRQGRWQQIAWQSTRDVALSPQSER